MSTLRVTTQQATPEESAAWKAANRPLTNVTIPDVAEARPAPESAAENDPRGQKWPDAMDGAALHGIAGEFVRMIQPNTEADPAAILTQFLVCFGAYVGREGAGPHYRVERDKHHANLYAIIVATIRDGWDSGDFRTLTKTDPATATNAHVCIIGHITADELRAELTATDTANGFANRFLFVAAKRSNVLPYGGDDADEGETQALAYRLYERMLIARTRGRITMTHDARAAWEKVYLALSAGGDGRHGTVTARAEAQVIRLALVYCLLDGAEQIGIPHLLAGIAVWQYCDATAKYIFGASLGDRIADDIMRRLQQIGDGGLTRTEIRDVFHRHQSAGRIGAALELLRAKGRATCETVSTDGRPTEVWRVAK